MAKFFWRVCSTCIVLALALLAWNLVDSGANHLVFESTPWFKLSAMFALGAFFSGVCAVVFGIWGA